MKNDIIVITKLFPDNNNPDYSKLIFNLCLGLKYNSNYNIKVIKLLPVMPFSYFFNKKFYNNSKHIHSQIINGVEVYYLKYLRLPFSYKYFETDIILRRIEKKFAKIFINAKIVYSHWVYPEGIVALSLSNKYNCHHVFHFHAGDINSIKKTKKFSDILKKILENSASTVFVSKGIQKIVTEQYKVNNPQVCYNGVCQSLFYPSDMYKLRNELNIPLTKTVYLSVGTLKTSKRFDLAIASFSKLNDDKCIYYIIGEGSENNYLQKLIKFYNMENKIFLLGQKTNNLVVKYMQASDYLIQPSDYESFGLVLVEAILCGTPVISTEVGGIPEIVDNSNGILVVPNNVEALFYALIDIQRISFNKENMIKSVAHFNVNNMQLRIAHIFNNISNS